MKDDFVNPIDMSINSKNYSKKLQRKMCQELDIEFKGQNMDHFDSIINSFSELYKDKQIEILKSLSQQERAVLEEEMRHRKDNMDIKHIMTYFGPKITEK